MAEANENSRIPEDRPPLSGTDSVILSRQKMIKRRSAVVAQQTVVDAASEEKAVERVLERQPGFDERELFDKTIGRQPDLDRYAIRKRLNTGGMGAIYYIFDRQLRRYSAMKVILPELKKNESAMESFIREARITGQLEHPNIVPVHDLGYTAEHGAYFTMKLIHGEPLSRILRCIEFGHRSYLLKYDLYALLGIFRKACDAVAFAHSRHILHRDLKPQNTMVGDYGEVLVMDWGLARRFDPAGPRQDADSVDTAMVEGSPAYMSPEQAMGQNHQLTPASDVFLLGATLYEMFTFYPPYLGDDVYEVVDKACRGEVMPPDQLGTARVEIPEELTRIMMKAMARKPEERYPNVASLCADIDALMRGEMRYRRCTFQPGEAMMRLGDTATECYIICKGQVSVIKQVDGVMVQACTLRDGDIVGEMALITHEPRTATVIADTPTEVLVMDKNQFEENLRKLPMWMSRTVAALAQRLHEAYVMQSGGNSAN